MKHYAQHTPEALAYRADHVRNLGTVAHIIGGADQREVQAFFINTEADFDCGLDGSERLPAGELIGYKGQGASGLAPEGIWQRVAKDGARRQHQEQQHKLKGERHASDQGL